MFRKALLALVGILVTAHAAPAMGADSGIRVTVVDAQGAMISDATAYLKSSTGDVRVVRSDDTGCAEFPNVPVGFYDLRVVAPSYSTATTAVELRYGESRLDIRAVLVKPLAQIGYVRARSTIDVQNRVLRRDAGLGRLSVTLADLLNTLGGAQVRLSSNGSLLGISLRGQDPSLTTTTFNGVSISGSQALRALDPDLMQSASINDQKESVDFRSLGTAPYPIYDAREMINGYAGRQVAGTVQGTSGKVGYAAATSVHGQQSALAGLSYADTSGMTYRHDGGYLNRSNSFKLAVPLSENVSLRAETMLRTSHEAPVPAFRSGPVPQGFGPGNVTDFNSSVVTTGIEATAGQWSLRGTLLNLNTADANDSRDRIVALQPIPELFHRETSVNAGSFSAVRPAFRHGVLNLNFGWSASHAHFAETFGTASLENQQSSVSRTQYLNVNLNTAHHGWSYGLDAGIERGLEPAPQSAAHAELEATWNRSSEEQYFGSVQLGTKLGPPRDIRPFDGAEVAEYDCSGNAITVNAPNDTPGVPVERGINLGYARNKALRSLSVQTYYRQYRDTLLTQALVDAYAIPASLQPLGYLNGLVAGFSSFGGCVKGASMPAVYFRQDIAGLGVDYFGADMIAAGHAGHRLTTQAVVGFHRAILRSSDPRLNSARSPYIVGRQLPYVAPLQASMTIDYLIGSRSEVLGNVLFFSGNNERNLPAYPQVTIGAVRRLSPTASLTVIASNALHSYTDVFASPRFAVPLSAYDGSKIFTVASPLQVPQFYAVLRFRVERIPRYSDQGH
ncbi:MAG: TonB-dependent receptor [Candidatus Eremiobacteraeota bacterium]|nr:TonB-dependent receptor [Candidatus Eremiobacteraeota bacterium]